MGRKITGPLEMIGGGESQAISAHELYALEQERMASFLTLAKEPEVDDLPWPINVQGIYDHTIQVAEQKALEIVTTAEDKASQIIANANDEGRGIVENARQDAERDGAKIRQQATEDGVAIRDQAKESGLKTGHEEGLEAGSKEGNELGHQEGWEQGYKEGWEQGRQEYIEATEQINTFLGAVKLQKQEIIEAVESDLIGLVFDIVEKVIHHQIATNQVVYHAVKSALDFAVGSQKLEIRVNPDDVKNLEPHRDEFYQLMGHVKDFEVVEDEEVSLGGCLLVSDLGRIDSRLETKLGQVEQIVRPTN